MKGRAIHYVDFFGDLRETACGLPLPLVGDATSIYLSGATCPDCQDAIQVELSRRLPEEEIPDHRAQGHAREHAPEATTARGLHHSLGELGAAGRGEVNAV